MPIKIPQDIRDVLDSNEGHQPVAFVDIYEERGDFQVIDTQTQLKAIDDPAVTSDVNVDFDRKPGFAVLAPGKRVDSVTTAIQKAWGSAPVDLSAIAPTADFLAFQMHGLFSIGNSVIVGFASYRIVGMVSNQFKGAQLTSLDGGLSYVVTDLPFTGTTSNLIFDMRCQLTSTLETEGSSGTLFDNLIAVNVKSIQYEYSAGNSVPVVTNVASWLNNSNYLAKINGIYMTQRNSQIWMTFDKTFNGVNVIHNLGFTTIGLFTVGSQLFLFDTFGQLHKSAISADPNLFSFTAIPAPLGVSGEVYYREVNGTIMAFSGITRVDTRYHYSTDLGVTWTIGQITTQNTTLKSYQNTLKAPVYSVLLSNSGGSNVGIDVIYTTTDGITWTEFFDKSQYDFTSPPTVLNTLGPGITYTQEGNLTLARYDNSYSDNATPSNSPTGFPITEEFEYDVVVSDVFTIDTGKGKK